VLADETVVLEATEDGVHLAQASRGEIRERVLRDPQRQHVSARILDTEPPRRLDERRRDPGAEVLRQEARQTQHERDPALRHERHGLPDLLGVRAGERVQKSSVLTRPTRTSVYAAASNTRGKPPSTSAVCPKTSPAGRRFSRTRRPLGEGIESRTTPARTM